MVGSKLRTIQNQSSLPIDSSFYYRNSSAALDKVKTHAEERLRTHLMKRHKVKDRGIGSGRFPSQQLYPYSDPV
jgi:hypothetical protein